MNNSNFELDIKDRLREMGVDLGEIEPRAFKAFMDGWTLIVRDKPDGNKIVSVVKP